MNERDFPHLVELPLPAGGFRSQSDDMLAFHRERGIWGEADHAPTSLQGGRVIEHSRRARIVFGDLKARHAPGGSPFGEPPEHHTGLTGWNAWM
jgi:hypothetical protein